MPTIDLSTRPPCLSLFSPIQQRPKIQCSLVTSSTNSFLYNFNFKHKKFQFLKPCSSLRETKKRQSLSKSPNNPPQRLLNLNLKSDDESESDSGFGDGDTAIKGTILAGLLLVGVVGGFAAAGYVYRDQINAFLNQFSGFIEGYGSAGYALFVAVYAGLEILAIPAIPLTMSAGLLFGSITGTIIVSISGTVAASIAFLIARYFARERILKLVEGNKKFLAIDKAIGENGFKVVTLLRLSPLLPFSLGNYLYGLTSVKFVPYVLGSWLGMLPGTWAYVSAGAFGRAIIQEESEIGLGRSGNGQLLTVGIGLLFTAVAAAYVTRLAKCKPLHYEDCNNEGTKVIEPECMEFISALAAGNRSKLILEITTQGPTPFTTALAVAAKQTGGRLVCIMVPHDHQEYNMNKKSTNFGLKLIKPHEEFKDVIEFIVGRDPSEVIKKMFKKVDFLVIDCKLYGEQLIMKSWMKYVHNEVINPKGCVVVSRNSNVFGWQKVMCFGEMMLKGKKVVECVTTLPIGEGIELTRIKSSASCKNETSSTRRRYKRFHVTFEN